MTDENGRPVSLRAVIDHAMQRVYEDDGTLLRDMKAEYPYLRLFLLGGARNAHTWPCGMIGVALNGNQIQVTLSIRSLEIESKYYDSSYSSLLATIENDLALDTVRWTPDWQGRKRLERKLLT